MMMMDPEMGGQAELNRRRECVGYGKKEAAREILNVVSEACSGHVKGRERERERERGAKLVKVYKCNNMIYAVCFLPSWQNNLTG